MNKKSPVLSAKHRRVKFVALFLSFFSLGKITPAREVAADDARFNKTDAPSVSAIAGLRRGAPARCLLFRRKKCDKEVPSASLLPASFH